MKRKKNKKLQKLERNTILKIGILSCSLLIFFLSSFARSYEVQSHSISLHNKLDYARLQKVGIKKFIYVVFRANEEGGGLFFNNSQFKTITPALEQLIKEFDFQKLDLCAWMITRNFRWLERTDLFDYQYEDGSCTRIRKLDIFNPGAVQKLIAVYRELASKKINCILIQDDFMIRYNEGLSRWGKEKFTMATEVPARERLMVSRDNPFNLRWTNIKVDYLTRLLELIIRKCKDVNSGIKIGMNIHYETPVQPGNAKAWYSHNLRKIMDTGIDYIYLMAYHRQIKEEMEFDEAKNLVFFKKMVEKAYRICKEKLVVKIQIRDWNDGKRIPLEEVKSYFDLIPPYVERVCFTPIKVEDFDFLEEIIGETTKKIIGKPRLKIK